MPYRSGPLGVPLGTLTRRNLLIKLTEFVKELVNKITLDLDICQANNSLGIRNTELYAKKIMLEPPPIKLLL